MGQLRAVFARNKKTLAVLGAVAVAGIAFIARSRGKVTSPAAGTATASTTYSNGSGSSSPTPYATTSTYDSTASDVYNSLQPQIEQLGQMLASTPVPDTSTSTSSVPDGFYQAAGDQAIFQAKNGVLDFLTHDEAVALGSPNPTVVTKRDPIWNAPLANPGKTIPWVGK